MTPQKTKSKAFLDMLDDNVSKTEFVSSFKNVVDYVKKFEAKLTADFQALATTMNTKIASMKDGKDGLSGKDAYTPIKGVDYFDGEDGEDGQDAVVDVDSIVQQVLAKIPQTDLTPILEDIKSMKEHPYDQTVSKGVTVYGPGKTRVITYNLSSQLNGSTKTFTLGTHFGILSVNSDSAPFGAFQEIIDYNAVGKTIVFTANVDAPSALAAGHSLIVKVLR